MTAPAYGTLLTLNSMPTLNRCICSHYLGSYAPDTWDAFHSDLCLAQEVSQSTVVPQCAFSRDNTWDIWKDFFMEHSINPLLNSVEDPIHYFMVFGICYHDGRLTKDGEPVRSWTLEEALHSIGQTMASLGSKDHCFSAHNKLEYHLSNNCQLGNMQTQLLLELSMFLIVLSSAVPWRLCLTTPPLSMLLQT
jgi:hypothetical protein